jgi:hypothetical protein
MDGLGVLIQLEHSIDLTIALAPLLESLFSSGWLAGWLVV